MATQIWVNFSSGDGLLPDGTKSLPEPQDEEELGLSEWRPGRPQTSLWPLVTPHTRPTKDTWAQHAKLTKIHFCLILILITQSVIILHMSRQLSCRVMCKIVTWPDHYFSTNSNMDFSQDLHHGLIKSLWNESWWGSLTPEFVLTQPPPPLTPAYSQTPTKQPALQMAFSNKISWEKKSYRHISLKFAFCGSNLQFSQHWFR